MLKIVHNVETGELIERQLTDEEMIQLSIDEKEAETEAQLKLKALEAKTALLEKLGITEEEAKLLLS